MTVNEDYKKYLKQEKGRNSSWSKFIKNVNPIYIMLFVVALFIGHYYNSIGKLPTPVYWGVIIALVVVILLILNRPSSQPELIPEHIIKQIAYDALESKRIRGEEIDPDAKVRVLLVGEVVYKNDVLSSTGEYVKREVGFEVIKKGLKQVGVIGVHPYNGNILGIRWAKTGYDGTQTKDRVYIPVGLVNSPTMVDNKTVNP